MNHRPSNVPRLLTLAAAEELTTIPRSTWYTIVSRREIEVVRLGRDGRSIRIREDDLLAWIEAHREVAS